LSSNNFFVFFKDVEHQQIFMEKLLDPPDVKMKSGTQLMLGKSQAKARTSTPYIRSVLQKRQPFQELPTVLEDQNRIKNKHDRKAAIEDARKHKIQEFRSKFANKRSSLIGTLQQRKVARDQAELDKFDEEMHDSSNLMGFDESIRAVTPQLPALNSPKTPENAARNRKVNEFKKSLNNERENLLLLEEQRSKTAIRSPLNVDRHTEVDELAETIRKLAEEFIEDPAFDDPHMFSELMSMLEKGMSLENSPRDVVSCGQVFSMIPMMIHHVLL
jgi:hypothetical protein